MSLFDFAALFHSFAQQASQESDRMDEDRARHIKELTEARNAVERQIEMLVSGSPPQATNRELQIGELIEQLRNTLRELEDCIAAESGLDHA